MNDQLHRRLVAEFYLNGGQSGSHTIDILENGSDLGEVFIYTNDHGTEFFYTSFQKAVSVALNNTGWGLRAIEVGP